MRRRQHTERYFPRGPEIIPPVGTRAWYEYAGGRRFYQSILPGQRFPKDAGPAELDRLANVRAAELANEAAQIAVVHAAEPEAAEPQPAEQPPAEEALVA